MTQRLIVRDRLLNAITSRGTSLASVETLYPTSVQFGGLPDDDLLETCFGHAKFGEDNSDSSDLDEFRMVRGRCKPGFMILVLLHSEDWIEASKRL